MRTSLDVRRRWKGIIMNDRRQFCEIVAKYPDNAFDSWCAPVLILVMKRELPLEGLTGAHKQD